MSRQPYKRLRRAAPDSPPSSPLPSDDDDEAGQVGEILRRYEDLPHRRPAAMRLVRDARGAVRAEVAPGLDNFAAVQAATAQLVAPGVPRRWHYATRLQANLLSQVHDEPASDDDASYTSSDTDDDSSGDGDSSSAAARFAAHTAAMRSPDDEPDDARTRRFMLELRANHGMDQRERFVAALYYAVRCARDQHYAGRLARAVSEALSVERMVVQGDAVQQVWRAPGVRADAILRSAVWDDTLRARLDRCPVLLAEPLHRDAPRELCQVCGRESHWASALLTLGGPTRAQAPPVDCDTGAHLHEQCRQFGRWEEAARLFSDPTHNDDTPIAEIPGTIEIRAGPDCARRIGLYHMLRHLWLDLARRCNAALDLRGLPPLASAARLRDGDEPELVAECWAAYRSALDAADGFSAGWTARSADDAEPGELLVDDDESSA